MTFLLHTRSPTAPADNPDLINAYHRVGRFGPRLWLPPTPWDNVVFAFMGDLVEGQAPPLVIWDTDVYFRQLNNQYAVPTPAALDQLLAGDPDQQVFGPFDPPTKESISFGLVGAHWSPPGTWDSYSIKDSPHARPWSASEAR
jgi:hypothetical protein